MVSSAIAQLLVGFPDFVVAPKLPDLDRPPSGPRLDHPGCVGRVQQLADALSIVEVGKARYRDAVGASDTPHGELIANFTSSALAEARASQVGSELGGRAHGILVERGDQMKLAVLIEVAHGVEHVPAISKIFDEEDLVHQMAWPRLVL